jgi:hypothetical protein
MSEMIERVALAIAKYELGMRHTEINQLDQIDNLSAAFPLKVTDHNRMLARIAIEAMNVDPTPEMIDACYEIDADQRPIDAWKLMIRAALRS